VGASAAAPSVSAAAPAKIVLRSICDLLICVVQLISAKLESPPFRHQIYPPASEPVLRIKFIADLSE
jgi:hypothetical protein